MGLLFNEGPGDGNQVRFQPAGALARLQALIAATSSRGDAGRSLHEIRQLVAKHPELEQHVPDNMKKPPHLIVYNEPPQSGCVLPHRPRRNLDDE